MEKPDMYAVFMELSNSELHRFVQCSYTIAAYSFGNKSGLFGNSRLLKRPDSTCAERKAATLGLEARKENTINKLLLIMDNQSTIDVSKYALRGSVSGSNKSQTVLGKYLYLEPS